MISPRQKKIHQSLKQSTLEREKLLFQVLGESLAEKLFFYFRGTVDFDYDEHGDGAFLECNLPFLFALLCFGIESSPTTPPTIRMYAKETQAEFSITFHSEIKLPEKEIYQNACLGGMQLQFRKDGFSFFLPLTRETTLHFFTNRESILKKLDHYAKIFGIL